MTALPTRRAALRVLGAALALPLGALAWREMRDAPAPVLWQGAVLGALSGMTLWHPNPAVARRAIGRMLVEIERLESIFSLYRPDTEIVRLNRDGRLSAPARDLVTVLDASRHIAALSGGAFDPTIQPLWQLHAAEPDATTDRARLDRVLALVDHRAMEVGPRAIRLGKPGMAISLNGIAQGYITDRITDILGNEGFESAMIELGETRALGAAPDGAPFPVSLIAPQAPGAVAGMVPLSNSALSVSAGYGMTFGTAGRHHILDPATGESARHLLQAAVVAPRAMWADALSTAIYVSGIAAARTLLAASPGARAILTDAAGTTHAI